MSKTDVISVDDLKGTDVRKMTLHNGRTNSLTGDVMRQLIEAVTEARGRKRILLTAEGEQFCTGLDRIDLYKTIVQNRVCTPLVDLLLQLYRAILTHDKATACIVQEPAHGGGVGLASCFDRVWAWKGAYFNIPAGDYRPLALVLIPVLDLRAHRFGLSCYDVEKWIGVKVDVIEAKSRGLVTEDFDLVFQAEQSALEWLRKNDGNPLCEASMELLDTRLKLALDKVRRPDVSMAIGLGIVRDLLERLIKSLGSETTES